VVVKIEQVGQVHAILFHLFKPFSFFEEVLIEQVCIKQEEGRLVVIELTALLIEMSVHESLSLAFSRAELIERALPLSHAQMGRGVVFVDGIEEHDESAFVDVVLFGDEGLFHGCFSPEVKGFLCEVENGLHPGLKDIPPCVILGRLCLL
jgi:hypothetical protein